MQDSVMLEEEEKSMDNKNSKDNFLFNPEELLKIYKIRY